MTLLDRIQNLQLRAVLADDESKIRTRVGEFTTLREQISSATSTATRVAVGRQELFAAGVQQDHLAQRRASALSIVTDLIAATRTLPVDAKIDAIRIGTRTVVEFFRKSEEWVEENWRGIRQSEHPWVDDELLDALEGGGVRVEAIRQDIERANRALLILKYRSIPEAGDYAKLVGARQVLASVGERISELIDPKIAHVVLQAQADGVPYSDFTEEVVGGLRQLGILERFRIVLK